MYKRKEQDEELSDKDRIQELEEHVSHLAEFIGQMQPVLNLYKSSKVAFVLIAGFIGLTATITGIVAFILDHVSLHATAN